MVLNTSGVVDEEGEHEGWVELRNSKNTQVDVGGLFLTNDLSDPTRWQIPPGTLVPAQAVLLFWLDGESTEGPLHTSFSLSAISGTLALFDLDGATLVDSISYEAQVSDVSAGRMNDDGAWVTFLDPSPASSNLVDACQSRRYGAWETTKQKLQFQILTPAVLGQPATFQLQNAIDSTTALLYLSINPAYIPLPGDASVLLVSLQFPTAPFLTDAQGQLSFSLNIPSNPAYDGLTVYTQMLQPFGGYPGSNAIAFMLCSDD